jgi:hypothetical protein
MILERQISQQNLWIVFLICGGPGLSSLSPTLTLSLVCLFFIFCFSLIPLSDFYLRILGFKPGDFLRD